MRGLNVFLVILAFMVAGCGTNILEWAADDASYEARLEEARMALDKGRYDEAISILKGMDKSDPAVAGYLSNAYAGKAGLDTFKLLETIDSFAANQTGNIDMVGKVLGGDDAKLRTDEITEKKEKFDSAINALDELKEQGQLTNEQKVQLGLLSTNRAALTIAEIIAEDQQKSEVTLTEEGIKDLYSDKQINLSDEATDERLQTLSGDINNIDNSIDAILAITEKTEKEKNDLRENFEKFKKDVDKNGDKDVTPEELNNFINNIVNSSST